MNREQMVERAAAAVQGIVWDDQCTCDDCVIHPATQILDAILPQVTTVAELEALPAAAVLMDVRGETWRAWELTPLSGRIVAPLTVVWQPEATA